MQHRMVKTIIQVGEILFIIKLEVFTFIKDGIPDSAPYMLRTYSQAFNENKYD
jgi:hypothetical protein